MIECAFEGGHTNYASNRFDFQINTEDYDKCTDFYEKYESSDATLKAIMQNIVKNGTFKP